MGAGKVSCQSHPGTVGIQQTLVRQMMDFLMAFDGTAFFIGFLAGGLIMLIMPQRLRSK